MSVPYEFTADEIERTKRFIIQSISKCRFINGKILKNPFVFYRDVADILGYSIECEDFIVKVSHKTPEIEKVTIH